MIYLITGVPGSGKTLRTIQLMDKFVKEFRPVFTNIKGIKLKGVMSLPDKWSGHWQDYDDGTVFVIDEVQEIWRGTGRSGMSQNEDVLELEKHRHRGMDFILTTQHPTFVENHVRKLVGKHEHINRPKGSKIVGISSKDHYFDVTSETHTAEFSTWKHPKQYYNCYDSATIHTHKFQMPKKLVFAGLTIAFLATVGISLLSNSFIFGKDDIGIVEAATFSKPVENMPFEMTNWAAVDYQASVSGCISSETKCICYSPSGQPLQITTASCFMHMEHILPRQITIGGAGAQSPRPADRPSPFSL